MQKKIILLIFFLQICSINALEAQCPKYDKLLNEGKSYLKKSFFDKALLKFQAAQVAARECGTDSKEADEEIIIVFKRLQKQRDDAIKSKKEAEEQRKIAEEEQEKAEIAKLETQAALSKADKLINAFYFYDGKFALASKEIDGKVKFGFINKDANVVIDYKYDKAEQFDSTGLAIVFKDTMKYFIDTTGNEYKIANNINEIADGIMAIDPQGKRANQMANGDQSS